MSEDYDGDIIIAPGTALFLVGSAALLTTFNISVMGYEAPV